MRHSQLLLKIAQRTHTGHLHEAQAIAVTGYPVRAELFAATAHWHFRSAQPAPATLRSTFRKPSHSLRLSSCVCASLLRPSPQTGPRRPSSDPPACCEARFDWRLLLAISGYARCFLKLFVCHVLSGLFWYRCPRQPFGLSQSGDVTAETHTPVLFCALVYRPRPFAIPTVTNRRPVRPSPCLLARP